MGYSRQLLLVVAVSLLAVVSAGAVAAADASEAHSAEPVMEGDVAPQVQENNETEELPVEPPTEESHPGYEYIRQEGDTEEKIELGEQLYFDPRISETGTISCNTCHNVMEGGDDSRPVAMGVHGETGPVASPTVWNSGFHHTQFWDGRADTLAEQAEGPIVADVEMGMPDHEAALDRVRAVDGYIEQYEEVYGDEVDSDDPEDLVTLDHTTDAIAAYERTLVTPNSPYDQYVEGDTDALTDEQLDGMESFQELGCQSCHSGPMFSGQWDEPESGEGIYMPHPTFEENPQCEQYIEEYDLMENPGRAGVTDDEADEYHYKVPTLRNVEHTAPYMHTGQVPTLEEAIRVMGACSLDDEPSDEEVEDIAAFLTTLTGEYPEQEMPRLPNPSGESMIPMDADAEFEDIEEERDDADETDDDGIPGMTIGAAVLALAIATAATLVGYSRRLNG
ncbi:cytochrome-c peroxidase [Natronobacterium gregoryi]|uniref:Cytochrome C peroxidase n=2 Tax=Natronobacterium gregoryi TaxID=44930 RepID=L0AM49_NATGS|nr:cytochrome c peroxidase [Natronobacterium gregoryi]AFZ74257.1 cytochrome c peroxidase [Natronobacterium gregoryi SP2]ELY63715.1 cytochrome-c peroxidase (CytC-type peroxidase) [Natronobacterium gregoryi SP2]PLK21960.1 cytochrome C peroxidase [Natronobacterium gregoryi SP2]SFI52489.1 cytochrome c peroxidase [Natronobacterium gregoryi]